MIKYAYNLNEYDSIWHIVNMYASIQQDDRFKLSELEIKFLSHIVHKFDQDPFKGETRTKIMNELGINSSSLYSNMLSALSMKQVLIKTGRRAKYELSSFFSNLHILFNRKLYRKYNNKITFQLEMTVIEE